MSSGSGVAVGDGAGDGEPVAVGEADGSGLAFVLADDHPGAQTTMSATAAAAAKRRLERITSSTF